MNKTCINTIKIFIIIVLAGTVVSCLNRILLIKGEDGINQMQALYRQPDKSIDVLFLGSSLVYCDIATGVLWDNYGIAAYDLGGAEAPAWVSYYQLKEALKTQKPKVVCYETSISGMHPFLFQPDSWAAENNYGMHWNLNRIEQLRTNSEEEAFYSRLNPFNAMHGRYSELTENDFVNTRASVHYKGFDPRDSVIELDTPSIDGVDGVSPCTQKAEEYIRKIIDLCKNEGIEIVLFTSPYDVVDAGQQSNNYFGVIAESEGIDHIDFNRKRDDIGLDYASDFADQFHLNYDGNYKYSDYWGRILKEKYGIPDRRGDERYCSWDVDARLQRQERNNLKIRQSENAEDVMNLAREGYVVFVVHDGKAGIFENGQMVTVENIEEIPTQKPFRLTYCSGKDSFLFTENIVNGDRMCSLYVNGDEHAEFFGNIVFVFDTLNRKYIGWKYF